MSKNADSSSVLPGAPPRAAVRYSWAGVPIPLLLLTIVVLWIADLRTPYEFRGLMVLLNVVFTWLMSLCICILTARGFLASGQPGLLMFGCGSLVWGATSLAAALILDRVNSTITVHNVGVFAAACCHAAGLLWLGRLARPVRWLVAGYAAALMAAALLLWAALAQLTPLFFVQGQGGTPLRQTVLLLAVLLFAWVAWQMFAKCRRQVGDFYYWYGLGLALTATALTGTFLLTVQGGILGWTSRLTQYLGCAYLLVAAIAAAKETGGWKLSLEAAEEARRKGELLPTPRKGLLRWLVLRYGFAVAAVAAAFGSHMTLTAWAGPGLPTFILFYPTVIVVALLGGLGPGLLSISLILILVEIWVLPPIGQFSIASPVDRLALVLFALNGSLICAVIELYRRNRVKAAAYERDAVLRESQARLSRFYDSPLLGVIYWNMDGKITDANDRFLEMVGYTREDLAANRVDWAAMTPPEFRHLDEASVVELKTTGVNKAPFEKEFLRKDGTRVPILIAGAMLDEARFNGTAFVIDITAHKRAEAAMRASEERYRSLFEGSLDAIFALDEQGRFLLTNQSAIRLFGYSAEELVKFSLMQLCAPDRMEETTAAFRDCLAGQGREIQTALIRKDGRRVELFVSGSPLRPEGRITGVFGIASDITERKQAEHERELAAEFLSLVNSSTGLPALIRAATGFFQKHAGCEAVGVRLKDGEDYPYYETRGFPPEFVLAENSLCLRDPHGGLERDPAGSPIIACMCGNVICGRFDPAKPYFTAAGSFWTNNTTQLLASSTEADRQARTRNRCNGEGYESVALVALRAGGERLGLLQLNDRRPDRFTPGLIACWERLGSYLAVAVAKARAEEALQASEERYRTLFKSTDELVALYTAERDANGRIVEHRLLDGNPAFLRAAGASSIEQLRGKTASEIFGAAWATSHLEPIQQASATGQPSVQEVHRPEDGRQYITTVVPLTANTYLETGRDITARKHAEEALRESEEMLSLAQTAAGSGVWDWDIRTGTLRWSDEFFRLFGLDRRQNTASFDTWRSALHPDDRHIAERRIQEAIEQRVALNSEYRLVLRSGEVRWVNALGNTIYDEAGKPLRMSGICIDITERIRAQAAAREARADLDRAQAVGQIGSWRLDIGRNILTWSDENYRIFDTAPGTPQTYETFLSIVHADDREYVDRMWKAALAGEPYDIEHRIVVRDGIKWVRQKAYLEFDDAGRLLGGFGIAQDITQRKHAEDALRQIEEQRKTAATIEAERRRLFAVLETLPAMICLMRRDHQIAFANRSFRAKFGEVTGRRCFEACFGQTAPCAFCESYQVFETGAPHRWEVNMPNGEVIDAHDFPFTDADGTPMILGMDFDITDRRRNEVELARHREHLAELVKERTAELAASNRELEAFAYSVSHDLRAPLRAMDGFSLALLEDYGGALDAAGQDHLRRVRAASQRMAELIDGLLSLSRMTRSEMRRISVNLSALAEAIAGELQRAAPARRVEFTIAPAMVVRADADLLRAAMQNLLANAWKFTSKRGTAHIEVGCEQRDGETAYFVRDDGAGFDMAYADKLFGVFQRLHSARDFEGTGIGLATVQRIIHRHGGRVWADSSVGHGATFFFTLTAEARYS